MRVVVGAEGVEDGLAELGEDFGVAEQLVEEPGQQGRGGVAAGQKDVEHLGAELDGVAGLLRERVEEDVVFLLVAFFGFLLH